VSIEQARDQFLGVYVTRQIKKTLREEADKLGVSISIVAHNYLADSLGARRVSLNTRNANSGRRTAPRGRLTPQLRAAIITHQRSKAELANKAGFRSPRILHRFVRGEDVALTEATLQRIRNLARVLGYKGEVTE
jgi:hypothetical protein